jgi:glycosyltransferase involved in cell wall biosynthesis
VRPAADRRVEVTSLRVLMFIERSGASRYFEVALPLLRAAVDVVPVTLRPPGELHGRLAALDFEPVSLGCDSSAGYPAAVARIARLVRGHGAVIVHAHESIPAALAGLACRTANYARCAFHRHHIAWLGKEAAFSRNLKQAAFGRVATRLADVTIAVSQAAARGAVTFDHAPAARVRVVPNGVGEPRTVEGSELARMRADLGLPADAPIVVIVARLVPEKGHATLFDAMAELCRISDARAHLVVVGTGPLERELRSSARKMRAPIHFAGWAADVAPWLALADVVAVPSYTETFGLAAIEALAARRPLVASDTGGLSEIVEDGVSGLLVPPGDAAALAAEIAQVLSTPELATALVEGGHRRYRARFTMQAMVNGWLRTYAELMGRGGHTRRAWATEAAT